ncbi:hypothetical protein [Streptomyces sp. NPDC001056]
MRAVARQGDGQGTRAVAGPVRRAAGASRVPLCRGGAERPLPGV